MSSNNKIEHVVLLMLENRSLDNLLGWLYKGDSPKHHIPPLKPGQRTYEGLQGLDLSKLVNKAGDRAQVPVKGASGLTIPSIAPGEEFSEVQRQLFNVKSNITPETLATMDGFLADYVDVLEGIFHPSIASDKKIEKIAKDIDFFAPHIMQTYTPEQVPVLNGLAKHYAVCDHWYSSVPSQTNTNRAFSLTGTSEGLVNNGDNQENPIANMLSELLGMGLGDDVFRKDTIFNALEDSGESWHVFWETSLIPYKIGIIIRALQSKGAKQIIESLEQGIIALLKLKYDEESKIVRNVKSLIKFVNKLSPLIDIAGKELGGKELFSMSNGEIESCYTYRLFKGISDRIPNAKKRFSKLDRFHKMARAGTLPKFTYIEPFWSISHKTVDRGAQQFLTTLGNDYHAPSNLDVGENYVKSIYQSLIANKEAWQKTLFIITFDEPVGTYDHIPTTPLAPPWASNEETPKMRQKFEFNRSGGRVPTILVSPYIKKGTVFRSETDTPYDHTSLIKSILTLVGQPEKANNFGERTKKAPDFTNVITENAPRKDEEDISFLQLNRPEGKPLRYFDRFYLQHENGLCVTKSVLANKINVIQLETFLSELSLDLGVAAYFPTLDKPQDRVTFYLQKSEERPHTGEVLKGDVVKLITTDTNLASHIVLGAWDDSHNCYYYNDYLRGVNNTKQEWTIETSTSVNAVFGQTLALKNRHYNQYLAQDTRPLQDRWISTREAVTNWRIIPVVD